MFTPWVGQHYGEPDNVMSGLRLLIVGESHYPSAEKASEWSGKTYMEHTRETIDAYAIEEPYTFFKKLARLATGDDVEIWSPKQHNDFWHSVAFYNFVPVFISPPSQGGRPITEEWKAGREPFTRVLAELRPDVVIVCGILLWWWVMDSLPGGEAANSSRRDTAKIGGSHGLRIPHVTGSRGADRYNYEVSRPLLVSLIGLSRV